MGHSPHFSVVALRPESADDESLLYELYASTRQDELALTGWDEAMKTEFLRMQFRAQRRGYRSMYPDARFDMVLSDNSPIGRMVVNRSASAIRVVDLVLAPPQRHRGIGTILMKRLIEESSCSRLPLRLQALRQNPVVAWYQRLGFRVTDESEIYLEMERPAQ